MISVERIFVYRTVYITRAGKRIYALLGAYEKFSDLPRSGNRKKSSYWERVNAIQFERAIKEDNVEFIDMTEAVALHMVDKCHVYTRNLVTAPKVCSAIESTLAWYEERRKKSS